MHAEISSSDFEQAGSSGIWILIGLGNPGSEYADTYHNVGFRALDQLATELGVRIGQRFGQALISEQIMFGGKTAVLVLPQTYMNRCGLILPALFERFNTSIRETIVVYDDLALPLGKIRVRQKGSAGGHNGIKSLISTTGTDEFTRVRVGIHPGRDVGDVREFVLSPVEKAEAALLDSAEKLAIRALETFLASGIEKAMADYNGHDLRNAGVPGSSESPKLAEDKEK